MKEYVASIDVGTGGVRCVIYDREGRAAAQCYREMKTYYTPDGRAEQDPAQITSGAMEAIAGALASGAVSADAILGISVDGAQTSFAPIDKDGKYLGNLILWQDMRGIAMFPWMREKLAAAGLTEAELYRRTLKPVDMMLSGAKLLWLRAHEPELYARIDKLANPQAVVLMALGAEECTVDPTDVGWWLGHNGATLEEDPELIRAFDLNPEVYPALRAPGTLVGRVSREVAERTGLRAGTPLFQGAVDQCCAALGAGNTGKPGIGTLCMGTVGLMMSYSEKPMPDPTGHYYVIPYPTGGFASELVVPVAASAFRWVRDMLFPTGTYDPETVYAGMDAEAAKTRIGADGVAFLPFLSGCVYPMADANMRGGFIGASLSTTRADLIRAALEGICYEMRQVFEAADTHLNRLMVLGGGARSQLWCQMQADVYGCAVETVTEPEATALGSAMIAAAGAGLYPSIPEAVEGMSHVAHRFEPDPARAEAYSEAYRAWLCCQKALTPEAFPALARMRKQ